MAATLPRIPRAQRGITLLELMIVVVIIALLAAIGYPSYAQYTLRAGRTEGRQAVLQYAAEQEKFYLNNNTYATTMTQLRNGGPATYTTPNGQYAISIENATASTFRIVATYTGTAVSEAGNCQRMWMDHDAEEGSSPKGTEICWDK